MTTVRLGFELGSGASVDIPVRHMVVTGLTQHAGKTTTLEALLTRSGRPSIAFTTKRGELGAFLAAPRHQPYFRERADWQYVEAILEAALRERLRFERSWIMRACKGAKTLRQVHDNVRELLRTAKGIHESVYTALDHYLAMVVPQIQATSWAPELRLGRGLNVMELTKLSQEMQALVIRSTIEQVMDDREGVITVLPEAWAFLPQTRGGPVKAAADRLLREGAVLQNFGWLDSQDLAGLDKRYLKHVGVWLLGCQPEANEAEHTLRQIPLARAAKPTAADIQALGMGEFYACWEGQAVKVYVWPSWLDEKTARAVAMGTEGKSTAFVHRRPTPAASKKNAETMAKESGDPAMCQEHAKLAREVTALQGRLDEQQQLAGERGRIVERLTADLAAAVNDRDVYLERGRRANALVEAWTALVGAPRAAGAGVDVETIVQKVLARIPTGGAVVQVTPPAKLRADFQQAEVDRLLATVGALKPLPRRILLLLEGLEGARLSPKTIAERLGRATGGGSWIDLGAAIKELAELGLVDVVERQGSAACVRAKIAADLATYGATEADVDATYQHVLTKLAQGD